jgi:hypothetical protein
MEKWGGEQNKGLENEIRDRESLERLIENWELENG